MALQYQPTYAFPGRVEVRSGANGHVIHQSSGSPSTEQALGRWVEAMGDLDGDGVTDVLVGGFVRSQLRSGATWQVLQDLNHGGAGFGRW